MIVELFYYYYKTSFEIKSYKTIVHQMNYSTELSVIQPLPISCISSNVMKDEFPPILLYRLFFIICFGMYCNNLKYSFITE